MTRISPNPFVTIGALALVLSACTREPISPSEPAGSMPLFSAAAPPAVTGLVSWWPGANTLDVAGPNDGAFAGGAALGEGKIGRGFSFDGINGSLNVPFHPSLNVGPAGSIVFWMRSTPDNAMDACCQGLVTTDYFAVEISAGRDPVVGVNFFVLTSGGGFVHTSDANGGGAVVSSGEWHHIAGTYDGTRLQLYVDGLPWGNPVLHSGSIPPMQPGSFLAIGSENGRRTCSSCVGSRYFRGQIDEAAIYDRALTAGEVFDLSRHGGSQ